jgi:anti-anti-sigma regulatory factor
VLDLSRVRFADSAFAQLMFDLAAELEYDGGSLRIINAYGTAATVLRVLGIPHTTLTALVIGDS